MASGYASGKRLGRRVPGKRLLTRFHCGGFHDEDLGCGVSFRSLFLPGIAVEVTEKCFAISPGSFGPAVDKGFDLSPTCVAQGRRSAEVGGIGLHQTGVEPMLADQEAEAVAEAW